MDTQFNPKIRANILLLAFQGADYNILNRFFNLSYFDPVDKPLIGTIMDYLRTDKSMSLKLLYAAAACTVKSPIPDWNSGDEDVNLFSSLFDSDQEYFGDLLQKLSSKNRAHFIKLDPEFFTQLFEDYDT